MSNIIWEVTPAVVSSSAKYVMKKVAGDIVQIENWADDMVRAGPKGGAWTAAMDQVEAILTGPVPMGEHDVACDVPGSGSESEDEGGLCKSAGCFASLVVIGLWHLLPCWAGSSSCVNQARHGGNTTRVLGSRSLG